MNIAQAQKELQELYGLREKIYQSEIATIESKIEAHKKFIKDNCRHHEDFLLVEETHETDEYDRHCPSWDKVIVTCTICDKKVTVRLNKFKKTEWGFRDLMLMHPVDIQELQ